jgi:16S rRNA (guanine966-N2)-methyltransferase
MDPPYRMELEKEVLGYLAESPLLKEDTLIIAEAALNTDFSYLEEMGFSLQKWKTYKTNGHAFIRKSALQE